MYVFLPRVISGRDSHNAVDDDVQRTAGCSKAAASEIVFDGSRLKLLLLMKWQHGLRDFCENRSHNIKLCIILLLPRVL